MEIPNSAFSNPRKAMYYSLEMFMSATHKFNVVVLGGGEFRNILSTT